jgi:MoaA/NifB/PqqE/SkfB family radical SAM enzyme
MTAAPFGARDKIAVLFLQPQCNMTCTFCITEDGFASMTLEQAVETLKRLKAAGVGNVILGGGEPFFWPPGAMALAAEAKRMGLFVQAGTNGLAMPDGYASSADIDRYIIPLESVSARIHDSLRHSARGHHSVIQARMQELGRAGKSMTLSTVITRRNLDGMRGLGESLLEYQQRYGNLHAWHLYRLLPFGRGGSVNGERLDTGKEEYDRVCAELRGAFPGLRIIKRPDMLNSESVGFFWIEGGALRCRARHPEAFGFAAR